MAIVSVSVEDALLGQVDALVKKGYSGRSDIFRAGLRLLLQERRAAERLSGTVQGVIIVSNDEKNEDTISGIRHKFDTSITTELHNHLGNHTCIHLFLVDADAGKITDMLHALKTSRKTKQAQLVVF